MDLDEIIKDPFISKFISRFPRNEWSSVLIQTIKLGIHSMNTVQTLSEINNSPTKAVKNLEIELNHDDSTDFLAESIAKGEGTTPSIKEAQKITRNNSSIAQKRKKTMSQVAKPTPRLTPKGNRPKLLLIKESKKVSRVCSVKQKEKRENSRGKEPKNNPAEGVKSFKNLKTKADILNSPRNRLELDCPTKITNLEFKDFYDCNMSCKNQKSRFPFKNKDSSLLDPFVYVTSSSDEEG